MNTEKELEKIRNGQPLTTVVMQYADAAMVGRLGAEGTAAIGLRAYGLPCAQTFERAVPCS